MLLRYFLLSAVLFLLLLPVNVHAKISPTNVAAGMQPKLSIDAKGTVRVVFGRADSIFCITSDNNCQSFTQPVFVGYVKQMHLGMSRGPEIASSNHYTIITAMDRPGNIHSFILQHATGEWKYQGLINDTALTAPEGLMSVTTGNKDDFYATWLDIRRNKANNLCFASLHAGNPNWAQNRFAYLSPDGHICECCRPSIAVRDKKVVIMFRNWIAGSRDLYVVTSEDAGADFGVAVKAGFDTWQLNACPMDGGDVMIDPSKNIHTVWRRRDSVYYCTPGKKEMTVTKGKLCSFVKTRNVQTNPLMILQENNTLIIRRQDKPINVEVGSGSFAKAALLSNGSLFCIWENDHQVFWRTMSQSLN